MVLGGNFFCSFEGKLPFLSIYLTHKKGFNFEPKSYFLFWAKVLRFSIRRCKFSRNAIPTFLLFLLTFPILPLFLDLRYKKRYAFINWNLPAVFLGGLNFYRCRIWLFVCLFVLFCLSVSLLEAQVFVWKMRKWKIRVDFFSYDQSSTFKASCRLCNFTISDFQYTRSMFFF